MPASIQHESGNLFLIRISGVLRQAELKEVQVVNGPGATCRSGGIPCESA